jgi:hypothetical protein
VKITCPEEILTQSNDAAIYGAVTDQVVQFAIESGVAVEHAQKMSALLDGRHAPAKLISPNCHVVDISAFLKAQGLRKELAFGFIQINPRDGRPAYQVHVDETADQHFFLLAVERLGPATAQGASRFWSYSLVVPETKGEQGLCVALDLNFDGENYSLVTSGRIYRTERFNETTRRVEQVDRSATLDLPTNILAFSVNAGIAGGMPILEARQNRMSRQERAEANRQGRSGRPNLNVAPPPMVPAGAAPSTPSFNDPFGDQ